MDVVTSNTRVRILLGYHFDNALRLDTAALDDFRVADGNFVLLDVCVAPRHAAHVTIIPDKCGHRTAFYTVRDNVLYFASNLRALLIYAGIHASAFDFDCLVHYYFLRTPMRDRSFLRGIRKLPPGVQLSATPSREVSVERFFDFQDLREKESWDSVRKAEIADRIVAALDDSIRERARSTEGIMLGLSGGVDSGFIARRLRAQGIPFRAVNLVYDGHYSESERVDEFERFAGIGVDRITLRSAECIRFTEQANRLSSDPIEFGTSAAIKMMHHSKDCGCNALWDGDGADRLFLGMNSHRRVYRAWLLYWKLHRLGLSGLLARLCMHVSASRKAGIFWTNIAAGRLPEYERNFGRSPQYVPMAEEYIYQVGYEPLRQRWRVPDAGFDFGSYASYLGLLWSSELFFRRGTEQLMRFGGRQVSPFWSTDMLRIAMNIPSRWKLRRGETKYILRQAAGGDRDSYWKLPKVGLADPFAMVKGDHSGYQWLLHKRQQVLDAPYYPFLHTLSGYVNSDALVPLQIWLDSLKDLTDISFETPSGCPRRPLN